MKTDIHRRNIATALALHAGGCVLVLMFGIAAAAAAEKQATFSDVPGVTPTNQPATNAPTFTTVPEQPQPATTPPTVTPPPATNPPPVVQPPTAPPPAPGPAEEEMKEKTLYSFQSTDLDLKSALAAFARANNLNIVPDNDVGGTVTLDVRDLPLKQIMRALLEANDCVWNMDSGLIRVHTSETRTFSVDYLRLSRKGIGYSSAVLASGSGSSGGTSGGGMTGGGGGGGGGGGIGGGGGSSGSSSSGSVSVGGSSINLTADNPIDF